MMTVDQIEYRRVSVDDLQTYDRNPRRGDVVRISESLRARGQYRPIVVNAGTHTDKPMEVLAGNHTLLAARSIGWQTVDCGIVDVDADTAAAIVLSDNRLADLGGYDDATLVELLEGLDDIAGTGYSEADLNALIAAQEVPEELTDRDDAPDVPTDRPISVPGDVYELGGHRVWCGDSTDSDGVIRNLLHDGPADTVWTDPPYGVNYVGKTKDSLTIDNDDESDLGEMLHGALATVVLGSRPGAPVYMASPQGPLLHTFQQAFIDAGILWRQNLVWVKKSMVLGRSDYHYKHEPILEGSTPSVPDGVPEEITDHDGILYGFTPSGGGSGRLGRGGPNWFGDNKQTTVFDFPKPPRNGEHPTMKPVDLVLAMVRNSTGPSGVVLDLFGGSGSTLIACHVGGYRARIVELDPRYVDVICRRFQQHTGMVPLRDGEEVNFL